MKLRLRELREERGLTQAQVAEAIGVSRPVYCQYESNNRKPSFEVIIKLADYFDITTDRVMNYRKDLA